MIPGYTIQAARFVQFARALASNETEAVLAITARHDVTGAVGEVPARISVASLRVAMRDGIPIAPGSAQRVQLADPPSEQGLATVEGRDASRTPEQLEAERRQAESQAAQTARDNALADRQAAAIQNRGFFDIAAGELANRLGFTPEFAGVIRKALPWATVGAGVFGTGWLFMKLRGNRRELADQQMRAALA
jgi:hypothetical protein